MSGWGETLNELIATSKDGGPVDFDGVRRKYLAGLAARTKRNVILYATKWTPGGANPDSISITAEDVQGFMAVVHGLSGKTLDLVLHSPGGSIESTEAIVSYLRSKFEDVRVIIPQAAMSAASMLSCSSNRILMGRHSSIGPIDPQFIIRTDQGIASVPAHAILQQFELAKTECRDPALLPSWIPILRQYGPALIIQCKLAIALAQELVGEWLEKYMLRDVADAGTKAKEIAKVLSDHGRILSHSRFISRERVKSLGLVVEDLEADQELQDLVLSVFHATTHTFDATPCVKLIENQNGKAFVKRGPQQLVVMGAPPGSG